MCRLLHYWKSRIFNSTAQRQVQVMPSERILICGAGIAGSILAFWLGQYDFEVVVVERSKADQKAGQGLEIEEPALTVVRSMGVLDELNDRRTGELGFDLVDAQARSYGVLGVGGPSPTGALEIMRGDLTDTFYKAADRSSNVNYRFETVIHSLRQTQDKVIVDLENRNNKTIATEEFDLVVGADGAKSRTRQLVMGSSEELNCMKPVGAFVAYFSIPKEDHDWPNSQLCHFPGRRAIWKRPVGKDSKVTSVYFVHVKDDIPNLRQANNTGDRLKQKEILAQIYGGLGWETPRIIEQMMRTDNFYSDELVQVKLPRWSRDRVALLGDAAWAPTPFSGEGNQLAIIGAWVLAQEMSRNRNMLAFEKYEKRFRSYVEKAQNIPLGGYAPYIFVPQTDWGIWLFRTSFRFFAWFVHLISGTRLARMSSEEAKHPAFDLEVEKDEIGAR